jgi:RNA polymerase sigma-70 factor, ECF subfamily
MPDDRVSSEARGGLAPAKDPADLRLAELIRQKDRKATAELIARYADAVYAFIAHRLQPNLCQAEDLTQEVFLAAMRSMDAYRGSSPLRQWLLGIARNKVQDYYRQRVRETALEDTNLAELTVEHNLAGEVDGERQRQKTLEVLGRMRDDYSALLRWSYWEGKSTAEIAALSGRTEKAVERALARARNHFSILWKEVR